MKSSHRPDLVVVHPLVLLSVVDHYKRVVAKNKNKRVAGVLLGIHPFSNFSFPLR
jgi:26S proteasome regulatory subunit N8